MTTAALHATAFYSELMVGQSVFTLLEEDSFPVLRMDGYDVIPFWSSRSRVERVRKEQPKYASYVVDEIPLLDFLEKTLALMEEEGIRVGVNWSGARLTGYDIAVANLRSNIAHHQKTGG